MQCPRCQQDNPSHAKFCLECATPLQTVSPGGPPAPSYAEVTSALSEALERETATGEILRVISGSPTDLQPVLDAVAERAARLCQASDGSIFRLNGEALLFVAHYGSIPAGPVGQFTLPLVRGTVGGRTVLERRVIHVRDLQQESEEFPEGSSLARRFGHRTILGVPLLRAGVSIGCIQIRRAEVEPFTEKQVELLQIFADQAVIAIENVRLFTELQDKNKALTQAHAQVTESLEQQTATSEILRVISGSPTETQPVFEAIAESVVRLCDGLLSTVFRFDGTLLHFVAHHGVGPVGLESMRRVYPMPPNRSAAAARAVLDCRPIHIPDVLEDSDVRLQELAGAVSWRSCLSVPMLREGKAIGAIAVARTHPGPFSDTQIELLKTFADQAVIAIENVRLFKELEARNSDLTEALEQQTATSEILRVISSSPTDAEPVFEAITQSAMRLCDGTLSVVSRYDGELIHLGAYTHVSAEGVELIRRRFPMQPMRDNLHGRVVLEGGVVHIPDVQADSEFNQAISQALGTRSTLGVPMLLDGRVVGAIAVARRDVRPFTDKQIALLKTFADQAVIAIENARLFKELQEKNHALMEAHEQVTEALEKQTATSEILKVISRSQTKVEPVFDTIVQNAARLCHGAMASVLLTDGRILNLGAIYEGSDPSVIDPAVREAVRAMWPRPLAMDSQTGTAILTRSVVHIPDIEEPSALEFAREVGRAYGFRSQVTVPMLREREAVGAISVARREPGRFSDAEVELLKTFADQAVIAIENVRLFNETKEALEQQTATSEILRVISSSPTDVQPVFDTIAEHAVRLCDAAFGAVVRFDGEWINIAAHNGLRPDEREAVLRYFPIRATPGGPGLSRVMLSGEAVHIPDVQADPKWRAGSAGPHFSTVEGFRTFLAVPLIREGLCLGAVNVWRREVLSFSEQHIELLRTFADQAVIAIENVRLFKELEARTAALTRSVDQLTALGDVGRAVSSTLDLETVLTTIVSRAVELSGLDGGIVSEYEEATEEFVQRAASQTGNVLASVLRGIRYRKGEGAIGQTAITRQPVQVPDITVPGAYDSRVRTNLIESGVRAVLAVPMIHQDRLVGCLGVTRNRPGDFLPETIDLLRTFAAQSALAIQNARLFREIEEKSRQLELASQHKSEFLANMSHELRTPLNAIIGFSEVLTDRMFGELNEKQEEYLKDIYASGTHLLSLINDILDLSKIEAGRMELELTDFDLPTAIENALTLVRERAGRRSIALHTNIDTRLGQIQADERKVRQVVLNLLSNAIKFTPEGGRIEVGAVPKDGFVEVSVSDTGIGIAPEDQEKVFEEFRQVGTAAKKIEGTGLGLTLCRKFVELHGGRIWVKSQEGVSSTFTFTIPVRHGE